MQMQLAWNVAPFPQRQQTSVFCEQHLNSHPCQIAGADPSVHYVEDRKTLWTLQTHTLRHKAHTTYCTLHTPTQPLKPRRVHDDSKTLQL